ncbi:MAG: ABC transporter ATP-binding protein [Gammaproteobacteria bacterium]|jgi:ABC-2 type transport system ATP-binding protein|nr:ABC transporter ATP-binding protein [Gammaproteobacteria bacterium]
MSAVLEVSQLARRDGPRVRVSGVSFTIQRGEVVGLLGLNGAGKSTTLAMIAGVLGASAGTVSIDGKDLVARPLEARAALGYLPDEPPLYRELTVDEHLDLAACLHGLGRGAAEARRRIAKRLGLAGVGRRLAGRLSRGYRQRVGLALALLHEPALVVLDEPTSGLDPAQAAELRGLVGELGRERAVLFSSHRLDEVQRICHRVEILHEGRQVASLPVDPPGAAGTVLVAVLAHPPGLPVLEVLPGVAAAESLAEGRFRLRLRDAADRALVAQQLVTLGYGLLELGPERPSLERRFLALTRGEAA